MSRIRANKITNKIGTGAVELEKGAHLPVGMGITGAGGLNITGVITATTISATTYQGVDSTALKDSGGNVKVQAQASGAVYTGIHTFNSDIDVDGHTNLDNVNLTVNDDCNFIPLMYYLFSRSINTINLDIL